MCPWCYLGVRRLLRTLRRRPDVAFDLIWRPFLLNPDMPRMGMPRPDYVVRKFGGEDRAKRLYATISEVGRHEGLEIRFDRIRRTPSSIDAHRLVRYAAGYGWADSMVEALFAAHFIANFIPDLGQSGNGIGRAEALARAVERIACRHVHQKIGRLAAALSERGEDARGICQQHGGV